MKNNIFFMFFLLVLLILMGLLYACASNKATITNIHPVEIKGLVNCAGCHTDKWGALNHKADDFYRKHKFYAGQEKAACAACHQESFCSDCHAYREEIKPSDKYKGSPERYLPHRGDYLSRHRIEGRIDPASCVKCHGRQNNDKCRICHR